MFSDKLFAGVNFQEVDTYCKKNFSPDFKEQIRLLVNTQIQQRKPYEINGSYYYMANLELYSFKKKNLTDGTQITEELFQFLGTFESRRNDIRRNKDQYNGYGKVFLREVTNWLNHYLTLGSGIYEMGVFDDAVWLLYRIHAKDIESLNVRNASSTSTQAKKKHESKLSVVYQERTDDMGEHGFHHYSYYSALASMRGHSGIIQVIFRAEKFFKEDGGYLEGITHEWSNNSPINCIKIFSKEKLLPDDDKPELYQDDNYYIYEMPADIKNTKDFYCYNPNGYGGKSSIEVRELFANMKEYYQKIFKIKTKKSDPFAFQSWDGDDLQDEGIGSGFTIYT